VITVGLGLRLGLRIVVYKLLEKSDKMRINHVIKTDQWRAAPQMRPAPHFVVSLQEYRGSPMNGERKLTGNWPTQVQPGNISFETVCARARACDDALKHSDEASNKPTAIVRMKLRNQSVLRI